MVADNDAQPPARTGTESYPELQSRALDAVEHCLAILPLQCLSDVDLAEKAVNYLRDRLIEDLRQVEPSMPADKLRDALNRSNIALSMIVGVEYPATGSQRKLLEMTRDTLRDMQW